MKKISTAWIPVLLAMIGTLLLAMGFIHQNEKKVAVGTSCSNAISISEKNYIGRMFDDEKVEFCKYCGKPTTEDPEEPPTCYSDGHTAAYYCFDCNASWGGIKLSGGHDWETVEELLPTCEQDGHSVGTRCKRCNEGDVEVYPAIGHSWSAWEDRFSASCQKDGERVRVCNTCGKEETEVIPKLPHQTAMIPAVSATCVSAGSTEGQYCTVCNTVIIQPQTVPATGHCFHEGSLVASPTCLEEGMRICTCTACGAEQEQIIPALGHQAVLSEAVAATCTQSGYTAGERCSRCLTELKRREEIPPLGHAWGKRQTVVAETCTESGTAMRQCIRCLATVTVTKPPHGHDWKAWNITEEPTCQSTGKRMRICEFDAEHIEREEIAKLPHCVTLDAAVAATCARSGLTEGSHCDLCGEVLVAQEVLPLLAHSWEDWKQVSSATYRNTGTEMRQCSVCGDAEYRLQEKLSGYGKEFIELADSITASSDEVDIEELKRALALYSLVEHKEYVAKEYSALLALQDGYLQAEQERTKQIIIYSCSIGIPASGGAAAGVWMFTKKKLFFKRRK